VIIETTGSNKPLAQGFLHPVASQGVLPMLSTLLARKVGSEHIAAKAWLMQTQRSAGMLSALIALQPSSTLRKSIGQVRGRGYWRWYGHVMWAFAAGAGCQLPSSQSTP
jgi:hypothetical protein